MHILSFGDYRLKTPRTIVAAEGNNVFDQTGAKYFDSMSGLWCVQLGYSQESVKQAISSQLETLPYYNNFFHTSNPAAEVLVGRLNTYLPNNTEVYFSNSGSMANETAIKVARRHYYKRNQPKKSGVLFLESSYHGSSIVTAMVSDQSIHRFAPFDEAVQSWKVPFYHKDIDVSVAHLERVAKEHKDEICAIIIEAAIGAGGVFPISKSYFEEARKIADQYDFKIILDEVVTGYGKLGSMFAATGLGINADIITLAKGMTNGYQPLGATLISPELTAELKWFNHGHTFSAHPVAMSASVEVLNVLDAFLPEARKSFAPFAQQLSKAVDHPKCVEIRTIGMMGAVEFEDAIDCKPAEELGWMYGIITRCGSGRPNILCCCLPLTSTSSEIEKFCDTLAGVMREAIT